MKMYREVKALDGGEWLVSHPDRFNDAERAPRYPLGVSRSRFGRCADKKMFAPPGNRTPAMQPVARHYIY